MFKAKLFSAFIVVILLFSSIILPGCSSLMGDTSETLNDDSTIQDISQTEDIEESDETTDTDNEKEEDLMIPVSNPLSKTELSIPDIAEKLTPSVVTVIIRQKGSSTDLSMGSGFIITEDGYIVTNEHVVNTSTLGSNTFFNNRNTATVEYDFIVILHNGEEYKATLIGGDSNSDIALLKIDEKGLIPAAIGDSDALRVGELAVAIGNPYSLQLVRTVTAGIISGIRENMEISTSTSSNRMDLIQTDAAINQGNSGGPLVNKYGEIIGVNSLKIQDTFGGSIEGLGFAIPINNVMKIVEELMATGKVEEKPSPSIGVSVAQFDGEISGIQIMSINETGDAGKQGLLINDVITYFNGVRVRTFNQLYNEIHKCAVGDTVTITVWRAGNELDITFKLIEQGT